jgi:hypothetical protein
MLIVALGEPGTPVIVAAVAPAAPLPPGADFFSPGFSSPQPWAAYKAAARHKPNASVLRMTTGLLFLSL